MTMSICFGVARRAGFFAIARRQTVTQGQPQLPAISFNNAILSDVPRLITTNSTYFNPLFRADGLVDDGFYYGPNRRNVSNKIIGSKNNFDGCFPNLPNRCVYVLVYSISRSIKTFL